jgi:predicted permease
LLVLFATVTLAVCIGANTTIFSIADSILLRPLPYPESARIDWISERAGPAQEDIGTAPDYYRLRRENRVFEDVAGFNPMTVNWTGVERPVQLDAAAVSASFFRVMGMRPMMGRHFAPEEEGSRAPPVAVLSYDFWRNRLGADPRVIGRTMALDRETRTIIGVMPQGFDFPRGTQVWMPWELEESSHRPILANRPIFTVSLLAHRKAGVSPQQVEADLNRLSYLIREDYKVFPTKFRWDLAISAKPLQQHLSGQIRPALLALSGAAGLVLLIACANLASLLLARAGGRQRELAVRMALGANRGRVLRQMLTETLVLAAPGGLAGLAISWFAVRMLNAAKPDALVRYPPVSMDLTVLAVSLGLMLAAGILFGIAPAVFASGIRVQEALKSAGRMYTGGADAARMRKMLIVVELSVSLVLLVGAGALARAFLRLAHTDLGFRTDHLLTFRVSPIGPFDHDYSPLHQAVLDRVQYLPGVRAASLLLDIPLSDEDFYLSGRIRVAGRPVIPFNERPIIHNTLVSPEFFRTLEIPVKSGRTFDRQDFARTAGLVSNYGMARAAPGVVNEALVRSIFPGENPLGRQLVFGPDRNSVTWTIIGAVGDVRAGALDAEPLPMVYRCTCDGSHLLRAGFAVRTRGDPKTLIGAVEEQVRTADPDLPVFDVKTMEERRAVALAPERFQFAIIGGFAGIALLLAAAGVYGVMSYLVSRRTREIGIRVAMGAGPGDVRGMVIRETAIPVAGGVGAGLAGAWALTGYMRSMLAGVREMDFTTFGFAAALLGAVVLGACLAPARHAARIDPMRALREE